MIKGLIKLFVAFVALTAGAACSKSVKDPAIIACELAARKLTIPTNADFQPLEATVDASTVTLLYRFELEQISSGNQKLVCSFTKEDKGFVFKDVDILGAAQECVRGINPDEIKNERQRLKAQERVEFCAAQNERLISQAFEQVVNVELPLTQLGIYPISPTDTELTE